MKEILDQFFLNGMNADVKDGYTEAYQAKIVSPVYKDNKNM